MAPKSYYTVIDELLQGPLPEEEKGEERVFQEAVVLVNAAAETTTWSGFPAALRYRRLYRSYC
jgi:hypothetical protein